jgi:prepilin-type N-terminal cleavage/methylation domain-containing protein
MPKRSPSLSVSKPPCLVSFRRGVTLLELAAVVLIIGLVGAVAAARYGGSAIADVGAQGFARRLALDCLQARRRAISVGDNHLLRFTIVSSKATEYGLYRRQGGSVVLVDEVRSVPANVDVTTGGATDVEFTFTGEALNSYTITVQAPDRTRTVVVYQVTGQAVVQ